MVAESPSQPKAEFTRNTVQRRLRKSGQFSSAWEELTQSPVLRQRLTVTHEQRRLLGHILELNDFEVVPGIAQLMNHVVNFGPPTTHEQCAGPGPSLPADITAQ